MSRVTLLVGAPTPQVRAVKDVLRDWSAAQLIQDFLWVDAADLDRYRPRLLPTDLIRHGRRRRAGLQQHLADELSVHTIRLCAISHLGPAPGEVSERMDGLVDGRRAAGLNTQLATMTSQVAVTPMHCVIAHHDGPGWRPEVSWLGWHNLLIAPEDSWNPGRQIMPAQLVADSAVGAVGAPLGGPVDGLAHADFGSDIRTAHAAAAIAGFTGLWRGVAQGPFDQHPIPGSPQVVVGRSFLRRLDASAVTGALRAALTDVSKGLPHPHQGGRPLEAFDNPAGACEQMAKAVIERNPELFDRERVSAEQAGLTRIGAWQLFVLFAGFVGAAARQAPARWMERIRDRAAVGAARKVQDGVFGGRASRFEVVLSGMTAAGKRADIIDLEQATADLLAATQGLAPGRGELRLPQLGEFWRDVASGALTLADGADHLGDGTAPLAGDRRGLVDDPALIAPSPQLNHPIPDRLAMEIKISEVAAHDMHTLRLASGELRRLESSPTAPNARDAGRELEALTRWAEPFRRTYVGRIGDRLADELRSSLQDVVTYLEQLRTLAEEHQVAPAVAADAGRLGTRMRWGLLGASLLIIPLGALTALSRVSLLVGLGGIAAVLLITALACGVSFFRSQQAQFARQYARRSDGSQLDALGHNLAAACRELHTHVVLYCQYQAWARILGRFLGEPFGSGRQDRPQGVRIGGALPRGLGLGVAVTSPERVDRAVQTLSPQLFPPGWLATVWDRLLDDAAGQLARSGAVPENGADALRRDRAVAAHSPLRLWAEEVAEHGVGTRAAERVWQDARAQLVRTRKVETLFEHVDVTGHAEHRDTGRLTGTEFLAELTGTDLVFRDFDPQVFTAQTRVMSDGGAAAAVHRSVVVADLEIGDAAPDHGDVRIERLSPDHDSARDLDQFVLLVQTTAGVPPDAIAVGAGRVSFGSANGDLPGGGPGQDQHGVDHATIVLPERDPGPAPVHRPGTAPLPEPAPPSWF